MDKIIDIIAQIELGIYALPEFQRGYVWNREQVKKLMYSLYHGYPIGSLLIWNTKAAPRMIRNREQAQDEYVKLILDGQQRITSLYGIIKGKAPAFFDGNSSAFTGLCFNLQDESFEFYSPIKMREDNADWINVTELLKDGVGAYLEKSADKNRLLGFLDKLNRLDQIKSNDIYVDNVTNQSIDTVVEIFNNINSGGTKLSKGDLALAKLGSQWNNARKILKDILLHFVSAGYASFDIEWLLRCVTVWVTGKPFFSELLRFPIGDIKEGVNATQEAISTVLNQIGSRLGLDHSQVLGSRYSIPVMIAFLKNRNRPTNRDWNRLLFWYIHTFLWGRYSASTESTMAQDLNALNENGVDGLIEQLRQSRGGNLTINAADFSGWGSGAKFYPLLYLLTRTAHAKDWGSGIELSHVLLGRKAALEVHHIFPKSVLYDHKYNKSQVNALGNFTFLTKETNLEILNKRPSVYIPEYLSRQPGAVESHWMPIEDQSLLLEENYLKFLEKRDSLLAEAANKLLGTLYDSDSEIQPLDFINREFENSTEETEEEKILQVTAWMKNNQLNAGEINYELCDKEGNHLATFDLAWPGGVQLGLSQPLTLLLDESAETLSLANRCGFKYFTDIDSFKKFITDEFLSE